LNEFGGGVRFVELAAITEPEFVVSAIADELAAEPKTTQGIAARIGDSPVLLILDNFEQVLAAAEAIGLLLDSCDRLRLLVTSQAPLRLGAEQRYVLKTLETGPDADSPGIQLFNQRARAVDPSFTSDPEEIAVLVQMLDGLPLAIELTAAMANLLTPTEMIKRLGAGKSTSRSPIGAPERHRSLDDALGWSYGLLDPAAQMVFRSLSVFAGGMTLNAAEEIAGNESIDPLPSIAELVDRSLLVRRSDSTSRFHMLDGVRRFARSRLAESDEHDVIIARYVDHFFQMAGDAHVGLQSDRGEWWRSRIDEELGNFREVLSILHRSQDAARGLDILGSLWRFYQSNGKFFELGIWLDRFFGLPGAADETAGRVKGLMGRAAATYWRGEPAAAIADYEEALAIARALGDVSLTADALYGLGASLIVAEQTSEALGFLEEAEEMYRDLGDLGGMADIVAGKAFLVIRQHGLVGLGPTFARAFDLYAEAGRQIQASQCILAQSAVAIAEGRFEDARMFAREAIERGLGLNDVFLQTWSLEYMARIELEFDNPELGALFAGAARSAREQMGGGWGPKSVGLATAEELLAERFGNDEATAMMQPGEAVTLAEAVGMALGADRPDLEDVPGLL
jgi:predicted ATPase